MKMDKEVRRSFERKNLERAAKKAAVVGLTTLVLSTSGIQANAASRYDNSNYRGIGYISKVEEVSELGNGGYISTGAGDYGGVSYGIYQFSTTTGSVRDFVNWTKKNDQDVYKYFKAEGNPRPSTAAFNRAWKKAYKELGTKFEKSQYNFASEYLIKPAYNRVKKRFGLDLKKSRAREEYLISTAVQFGPGGICNLFKEVENRGIKLDDNMDDSELLSIMCNHKRDTVAYHFRSSSSKVKAAARQRFIREKKELLKIAKEESGKTLDDVKATNTSTTKTSSSKEETNDVSTQEFDDVIEVNDKDIEKDYNKVEKELDEINDVISDETQDNTESKEEDKSTTEDEDTSKEETTDEETSKDESTKEDNTVEEDKSEEKEDKESDTKEETKDEDKQESTENDSSLDNTLFVGDSHMKGAESTIKNNYDNSQVKATVGASAYVYLHDTKFFGEKLINSLPEDSDDIHQVVVSLGVNNITGATNESDVIKVLEKLQAKYPGKPIRFMLVNHVGNKYTEASVSKTNKLIDNLNKTVSDYAKEHENVSVIDASEGLETNGKLTSTNDGLHVNNNKKLLNNIEKAVEEKQDKTTLEEAPDQVKTTDEFDSIVDEDTTKDIEEPDKATEEDNDKQESSKEDKVEEKDNDSKEETSKEDKQESTEKETTDEETSKDESTKEETKDEDKSTESEKESSKEETTTEDNTVEEDNDKETSKDESTKEDKSEEKDYDTKEETPAKENTTDKESSKEETKDNTVKEDKESDTKEEATDKETSKDESFKEDKVEEKDNTEKEDKSEEKAVEEKQETSKEETKDNTVKEDKSTESEKETSKEESTKEDKAVKETKEETPAKEEKQESSKENKAEDKAVEEKQETSKEKEQPVQEEKTTEKQETTKEDNSKQEDNSTEQSSDTLNELQSRLSNNLFGKLMS